jgi:HSP20 family protein
VDFDRMHDELLRAFDQSCQMAAARQRYQGGRFTPAADAYFDETTNELVARFELPGLSLEDIELFVDRREVVVRGERAFDSREGRIYQQVELDYGPFERHVRVSSDVDPEATTATYHAGILEVRMAVVPRPAGARKVDITKSGGPA